MSLGLGFVNWASNLSVNFETAILIVIMCGCLIFYAKGVVFGAVMTFFGSALSFMLIFGLYKAFDSSINYAPSLVIMFMSLIIMTFTLYFSTKAGAEAGVI